TQPMVQITNYVIQADADTDASTDAPVTIFPELQAAATAADVVTVKTGTSKSTYKKNFVYHRDGFTIGSRGTVKPGAGKGLVTTPYGWILSTKKAVLDQTNWDSVVLGSSTLFNIKMLKPEYSVVLLSA
ncbi:unnamed protein product, partial [marine sediment metagenome]